MEPLITFILFVLILLISSGIASGSEAAILSVSFARAKELSRSKNNSIKRKALRVVEIKENLQKYITTLVVLNNIINIIGSIFVGVLATELFGHLYLGVVSAVLTFLIILFSEIIPKVYGEQYADKITLFISAPLMFLTIIFSPIVFLLEKMTSIFVKKGNSKIVSEGEIKEMAALGKEEGSIESFESEVIENVFKMNDIQIYDIMVPKHKVVNLEKNSTYSQIVKIASESGFTRFPVIHDDEVIGVVNVKDLLKYHNKESEFKVSKILRKIIFAPEIMKLSTLERRFKSSRIHMAAIVNEHGDFTGIVTFEDIIEEIIGEISDEYDEEEEKEIIKIKENKFHILTSIEIADINEELQLNIPEDEDYSTLNGFLILKLDKIPSVNDTFEIEEGVFRIIKRSKKKIVEVEFLRKDL